MPILKQLPSSWAISLALMASAVSSNLAAEAVDGSKPLLCATVNASECADRADCETRTPEALRFPQFLDIDTGNKTISAERPDGTALNAAITTVTPLDDRLVLQGIENGLGWTLSISRATGHMAVAIAGDRIAFTVFGACTAR